MLGLIALLCTAALAQSGGSRPSGLVRAKGAAFVDDRGPWLPLGATLFWAPWGYKFDRVRLERELSVLSRGGVDYIRVLGQVGDTDSDDSWADRPIDPRWSDACHPRPQRGCGSYEEVIAGLTDLVFDKYGMRVEWTVFGATSFTPTPASRRTLIDRLLKMSQGREHKIMHFEVANEFFQNGFGGEDGLEELRDLARYMQERTPLLVGLSAPSRSDDCSTLARLYDDDVGEVVTVHFARATDGPGGMWNPVQAPWRLQTCKGLPPLRSSNEPIGPFSSVQADGDPLRIAMAAAVTYISGVGSYVLHTGAGVRGGGRADRERGRPANVSDVPRIETIFRGLGTVRERLPAEVSNWARFEATEANEFVTIEPPGVEAAYGAHREGRFVVAPIGAKGKLTLRARRLVEVEVVDPLSGDRLWSGLLPAGRTASVGGLPAYLVVGKIAESAERPDRP